MKKLLLLFAVVTTIVSCSVSDEQQSTEYLLPVYSATVPATGISGQTDTLLVRYKRPTDCHIFNGFYIQTEGHTQTISIRALKFSQNNCMDDSENIYEVPFEFTPTTPGTYTFKFWTGNNESGEPVYVEYESIVE